MLVRIALHQTRLRMPGLGLDARGVAIGARGAVLLPSLERLVAFLSLLSQAMNLTDVLGGLRVELLVSKLKTREVWLSFAADGSDRMDRVSEMARLSGGYTFTGTSRHFVQYRDAAAPFGYDPSELLSDEGEYLLYHSSFSQAYAVEREVSLARLLLRLSLVPAAPAVDPGGAGKVRGLKPDGHVWVVAERGLGPALIGYFLRSGVPAEVGVAEWPPASAFDEEPVQRYLFRVDDLPARMLPLMQGTPGILLATQAAPGVLVAWGMQHPVNLAACPVFPPAGLVIFPRSGEPLVLPELGAMGPVSAFSRVEIGEGVVREGAETREMPSEPLTIALRMVPSQAPYAGVTATLVSPAELPLLRRMCYCLGSETLRRATLALTDVGAFVRLSTGVEAIPLGEFYRELCPGLYAVAGFAPLPAVSPEVLKASIEAPSGHVLLLGKDARVRALPESAFVPLEEALIEAQDWAPLPTTEIHAALATRVPEVKLGGVGLLPLSDLDRRVDEDG